MITEWVIAVLASGVSALVGHHLLKAMSDFISRCLDRRSVMKAWEHNHDREDMLAAAQAMQTISGHSEAPTESLATVAQLKSATPKKTAS
ncbi:MAG: hypothetical protein LC799_21280 [Actinobacteria bacterium]|nr:hypothetical protein [Actinomycetota bacterium]